MTPIFNIVFMGTPDFSVPLFEAMLSDKRFEIKAAYCMPDKPKGRGKKLQPTPVKLAAEKAGIEVRTPSTFRNNEDEIQKLKSYEPDFLVVVAYGLILSSKVLSIPKIAAVNLHASILPKYRGPSPIHHAILNGDAETGNTAMLMNVKMDEGDILAIDKLPIEENDNLETLHDKLSFSGAKFLPDVLVKFANNSITPVKQDHEKATYTCKITPAMARISWNAPAIEICRKIKAMSPFPGAWFEAEGIRIKVFDAMISENKASSPGKILYSSSKDGLVISCGQNTCISLLKLQKPGKSRLKVKEFLKGFKFNNSSLV